MPAKITAALSALAVASTCLSAMGASRAFVSSDGNDADPCTLNSPCRNFQAGHNAVDPGGEVVALDSAGFGSVTISKSLTLMASPGVVAGIAPTSGDAITIATPGVHVALRGLHLNNMGPGGSRGVMMTAGASLAIENCVVSRFSIGVRVEAPARVRMVDTLLRGNTSGLLLTNGAAADVSGSKFLGGGSTGGFGLTVSGAAGTTTSASVVDSVASDNFSGFVATTLAPSGNVRLSCVRCTASNNVQMGFLNGASTGSTAQMLVASSLASYNGQFGFNNINAGGTATFESLGNNALHQNAGGATSGTITNVPGY